MRAAGDERYGWLGSTPLEIARTLFTEPGRVLGHVLSPDRLRLPLYLALSGGVAGHAIVADVAVDCTAPGSRDFIADLLGDRRDWNVLLDFLRSGDCHGMYRVRRGRLDAERPERAAKACVFGPIERVFFICLFAASAQYRRELGKLCAASRAQFLGGNCGPNSRRCCALCTEQPGSASFPTAGDSCLSQAVFGGGLCAVPFTLGGRSCHRFVRARLAVSPVRSADREHSPRFKPDDRIARMGACRPARRLLPVCSKPNASGFARADDGRVRSRPQHFSATGSRGGTVPLEGGTFAHRQDGMERPSSVRVASGAQAEKSLPQELTGRVVGSLGNV